MRKVITYMGILITIFVLGGVAYPKSADLAQEILPVTLSEIPEELIVYEEEFYDPYESGELVLGDPIDPVEVILTDEEYDQLLEALPEGAVLIENFKRDSQLED